jgi:crossover junction endodeoxyribonuclease RuvC
VRVLGIDPGSSVTGWGVVERARGGVRYVASGTISARGCRSFASRLLRIHDELRGVLRQWEPQAVGIERAFVARNVQSAFRLGEARGVALAGAAAEGVDVYEYTPATVKLAVAGSGRADKGQVGRGIARLLGIDEPHPRDASDALAVAICHLHATRFARGVRAAAQGGQDARPTRSHRTTRQRWTAHAAVAATARQKRRRTS